MPTLDELKPFIVLGLALGGVFAMSGVGLVVLYRTTGVLNLAYGAIGAARLAEDPAYRDRIAAVVALDSIGGSARPRLAIGSDRPLTASPVLVRTAAERVLEESGETPIRESVIRQLLSLAFPFSLSEQAPFVSRGVAAVTLTTAGDERRDPASATDETTSR